MTGSFHAAECECGRFSVSTLGATGWDRTGLEELARVHLRNCPADAGAIEIERRGEDLDTTETVAEVNAR